VDGFNRTIGALVITPVQPAVPVVQYSNVSRFQAMCRSGQPLRWVEVIKPA
jgi:hypothetical protein